MPPSANKPHAVEFRARAYILKPTYALKLSMQAKHLHFSAAAREALRAAVARLARAATSAVSIEGVRRLVQKDSAAGIVVRVCVETGPDVLAAHAVLTTLRVRCSGELVVILLCLRRDWTDSHATLALSINLCVCCCGTLCWLTQVSIYTKAVYHLLHCTCVPSTFRAGIRIAGAVGRRLRPGSTMTR